MSSELAGLFDGYTEDQKWVILSSGLKRLIFYGNSQKVVDMMLILLKGLGMDPDHLVNVITEYFTEELTHAWFFELKRESDEVVH